MRTSLTSSVRDQLSHPGLTIAEAQRKCAPRTNSWSVELRAVDHDEHEVVVGINLRALVELLGILDGTWMKFEDLAQDVEAALSWTAGSSQKRSPLHEGSSPFRG